jgi:hypothetical protein
MWKTIALAVLALAVVIGGIAYFRSRNSLAPSPDSGVPVYPGAKEQDNGSFAKRLKPQDRARLIKAVILQTDDPPDKVISFYKDALKNDKMQVIERNSRRLPGAVFRAEINGQQKIVMVTPNEDSGKTEILIGSVEGLKNSDIPIPQR